MADLVTLADPTSPYSFLNFLKQTGRLYRFYIRENFYPLRAEYNQYCQWVAGQLDSVRFGTDVREITYDDGVYTLSVDGPAGPEVLRARRLVLGTGTSPYVPAACDGIVDAAANDRGGLVLHNADYLSRKSELQTAAEHHHRGQRPECGGNLLRAAAGDRRPRVPAQLGHPVRPVLPAGIHQAHPGNDVAGIRGLLPRAPAGTARRTHQEPEEPVQGHQLRAHRCHLRSPVHQEPLRDRGHPAADALGAHRGIVGPGSRVAHPAAAARGTGRGLLAGHRSRGACHRLRLPRAGIPCRRAGPDRTGQHRQVRRRTQLQHRRRTRRDLRPERRAPHPRLRHAGPGHGGLPQLLHPARDHRARGLSRGAQHRVPAVRRAGAAGVPGRRPRTTGVREAAFGESAGVHA